MTQASIWPLNFIKDKIMKNLMNADYAKKNDYKTHDPEENEPWYITVLWVWGTVLAFGFITYEFLWNF